MKMKSNRTVVFLFLAAFLHTVSTAGIGARAQLDVAIDPIAAADVDSASSSLRNDDFSRRAHVEQQPHETSSKAGNSGISPDLNRDIVFLTLVVLIFILLDPLRTFIGTYRTVAVTSIPANLLATRRGCSQDYVLFNLISFGDASVAAAMQNGGITHIQTVEEMLNGIRIIFVLRQTIVVGYNCHNPVFCADSCAHRK